MKDNFHQGCTGLKFSTGVALGTTIRHRGDKAISPGWPGEPRSMKDYTGVIMWTGKTWWSSIFNWGSLAHNVVRSSPRKIRLDPNSHRGHPGGQGDPHFDRRTVTGMCIIFGMDQNCWYPLQCHCKFQENKPFFLQKICGWLLFSERIFVENCVLE